MLAMPLGAWLARRISASAFDRVILGLLLILSLRLIWQALAGLADPALEPARNCRHFDLQQDETGCIAGPKAGA
jgi:hypothetical protein